MKYYYLSNIDLDGEDLSLLQCKDSESDSESEEILLCENNALEDLNGEGLDDSSKFEFGQEIAAPNDVLLCLSRKEFLNFQKIIGNLKLL